MKAKIYLFIAAFLTVLIISSVSHAHEPGGSSEGGRMVDRSHGMMGGPGGEMMGSGKWISSLWELLSQKFANPSQDNPNETEQLRKQIRQKRRELASLYRSHNPDRKLIDQKIDELNRLEFELDQRMDEVTQRR